MTSLIFRLQILHSHIASVEKLPLNAAGSPLRIRCKNFQVVTLIISRDRDSQEIFSSLLCLSNPGKNSVFQAQEYFYFSTDLRLKINILTIFRDIK